MGTARHPRSPDTARDRRYRPPVTGPDVPYVWPQDLSVLRSATAHVLDKDWASAAEIGTDTGLDDTQVDRSLRRLRDAGYIDPYFGGGWDNGVNAITSYGLEAAGAWPTPDTHTDRLLAALEQAVTDAPTEEERSRRRKALDAFRSFGRDLLVNASGSALGGLAG
ncbi:MAG: hypothetical protein JWP11_3423 [Frankiales bacterium]|nr:hypothetical protein [Frankiales bacterium]